MSSLISFDTVFDLRQALETLLTRDPRVLGSFTEGENIGQPAIWVMPPDPPAHIDGIRCLIQRTPESASQILGSRQTQIYEHWQVMLTNFDPANKLMADAKHRIETSFLMDAKKQPKYLEGTGVTFEETLIWIWKPYAVDRRSA